MLSKYLEDLENRLDEQDEEQLYLQWENFAMGNGAEPLFSPSRKMKSSSAFLWEQININDALNDYEKMALRELKTCSDALEKGNGYLLNVRSNYGTGILPSLFGADIYVMPYETDTLPTSLPVTNIIENAKLWIEQGVPNLNNGYGKQVFEMAEYYKELFKSYPKISRHIHIYHPDLQSPIDACELLWGSDLFLDVFDEPALIKELLSLLTQTYVGFMEKWIEAVPQEKNGCSVHWGCLNRGLITLRNDSAMNFSPEMYDEFIRPYDQVLLKKYGGSVHFCGRGDHYIASLSSQEGIYSVNLSQPHLNDMDIIFANTIEKGINLFSLDINAAKAGLAKRGTLHNRVHSS